MTVAGRWIHDCSTHRYGVAQSPTRHDTPVSFNEQRKARQKVIPIALPGGVSRSTRSVLARVPLAICGVFSLWTPAESHECKILYRLYVDSIRSCQ